MTIPARTLTVAAAVALNAWIGCAGADKDASPAPGHFSTWMRYEGEPGATSFSVLDQINRSNVDRLEVAWIYQTPGASDINPLVVDSVMYVVGEGNAVVALHAASGRPLWSHTSSVFGPIRAHGFSYWESPDRADRRLIFQKGAYHMLAIDAATGEPVASFGEGGIVDLRNGLGVEPEHVIHATSPSPGAVFEDLIIVGSRTGEGYVAAPGHVRAFDVRSGRQRWIFHTLPRPGEYGYDTWPEGRSDDGISGGANAWGGISVDEDRAMVYAPLGSSNYDFYGIDRPGENLFSNSLVALNARTGERIWHFQTVHHDLWDYDLAATPVLLTVRHEGRFVDVVVQATKLGFVFVLDRETGEPLWPIEERSVPSSLMPGEQAWPTQPVPVLPEPFVPQSFDLSRDLNPYLDPADRDSLIDMVRNMHYEGIFTPPAARPTLQVPGNRGGANWGSSAGDPRNGMFYVLSYNMPSVLHLVPIVAGATGTGASSIDRGQRVYQQQCQLCHGASLAGQPEAGIASLEGYTERMQREDLEEVIRSGRGIMPPLPQLSEADTDALWLYLANPELALTEGEPMSGNAETAKGTVRYQSEWRHVLDRNGLPLAKPPWFRLTAYDLNEGTIKWQVPVGWVPHLAGQGIADTGSADWLRGGPAITAGGLIFQSAGDRLIAYDSDSGAELWAGSLLAHSDGIPAVYEVDGRQYIAVSATGASPWPPPEFVAEVTEAYVAFALPAPDDAP